MAVFILVLGSISIIGTSDLMSDYGRENNNSHRLKGYMECTMEINLTQCNCTYPCSRKGRCCECIRYHRERRELPGCYFTEKAEATYDRSVENYLKTSGKATY